MSVIFASLLNGSILKRKNLLPLAKSEKNVPQGSGSKFLDFFKNRPLFRKGLMYRIANRKLQKLPPL